MVVSRAADKFEAAVLISDELSGAESGDELTACVLKKLKSERRNDYLRAAK